MEAMGFLIAFAALVLALMALKKIDEAKAILEKAACENPANRRRKEHLLSFVVPRVAAAE